MLVLGVDPGLTRCGLGVVRGTPGRAEFVEAGVVRTPAGLDTAQRLLRIETGLEEWVKRVRPDAVAVERVFAQHNLMTVIGTAQAAGVALLVAARHGLPVATHTPSEVKAAITGSGRADKAQVGLMVRRILRLAETPKPADAADAVALAICHVWRGSADARLAERLEVERRRQTAATAATPRRAQPPRGVTAASAVARPPEGGAADAARRAQPLPVGAVSVRRAA